MNGFTIKDIENLSGVKAHTIRIWEQRYNFLKPKRTNTNIRYYSTEELKIILNIALLNKFGYKISHINNMNVEEMNQKLYTLAHHQARQELIINELISYMIDLEIEKFEEMTDRQIREKGIEKTIIEIIFPFLEKIGILWITSNINPGQERLVTNIIRQKIIVGIETAERPARSDKTALLFMPEGEFHELGLLYAYYILITKGIHIIYLGANIPLDDLEFVVKAKKPDYLYTHLTVVANNFNLEKVMQNINLKFGDTPVVISGPPTISYKKPVPHNIKLLKSLAEFKAFTA